MKILIYGFKPYGNYRENITEKVLKKIKVRKQLEKVVFPVRFEEKTFLNEMKRVNPDVILGLGQYARGKKARIERKSVNLRRDSLEETPKVIYKNEPKYRFVNLMLKKDKHSWLSYDAREYVCNYSMYIISKFCKEQGKKFAFIHIPKDFGLEKAVDFVELKIDEVFST